MFEEERKLIQITLRTEKLEVRRCFFDESESPVLGTPSDFGHAIQTVWGIHVTIKQT